MSRRRYGYKCEVGEDEDFVCAAVLLGLKAKTKSVVAVFLIRSALNFCLRVFLGIFSFVVGGITQIFVPCQIKQARMQSKNH